MRIVTGKYRGRNIKIPGDAGFRPTLGKVKEALFSTLGEKVVGSVFGDLFAGSGNIGFEALSRGAKEVVFAESSIANRKIIEENCKKMLSPEDNGAKKIFSDARLFFDKEQWDDYFDILFLDPPYSYYEEIMEKEKVGEFMDSSRKLIKEDGALVLECPVFLFRRLMEENMVPGKERKYGHIHLLYYRKI